ncbi:hypothetical protein MIND_00761200 [Mycena indigotica]|uniref:HMG box domain-containing protein n=1 Tax=Mycena indigotica TaxID=2126181 RepID=A0A8H6W3V7_9AGAR|nr:uncharacterized protein MIND_00761200 [Mycena indigotica]KAF7301951.1 hypothetical protein MIND_00761200 [Mycena indigotica]
MVLSRFREPLKQALRLPVIRSSILPTLRRPMSALKQHQPSTMSFFDEPRFEHQFLSNSPEEPMLFDFDDYSSFIAPGYDETHPPLDEMPPSPAYELAPAYSADPFASYNEDVKPQPHRLYLSNWASDPPSATSPTSPIPIPSPNSTHDFISYNDHSSPLSFDAPFSPLSLAAALPLPASFSPSSSMDEHHHTHYAVPRQLMDSVSPQETTSSSSSTTQVPQWAAQLWDSSPATRHSRTASSPRSITRHSPLSGRRDSLTTSGGQLFPSTSAPSSAIAVGHNTIRAYSKRAESFGASEDRDRDATVRRRKRSGPAEEVEDEQSHDNNPTAPLKSLLRPPKLAPSAWQLYFTDWIQRQQASSNRKLNVAQAAKEAGAEYASLSEEEKEPYKQRSQAAKEIRERELNAYLRSLTPEDIKRENAFRSAQRKAGKSRKSNIKDPNAPKKPLSAYFMFLQRIRADPVLVREIFGDETETTKQSVLAAAKWRAMSDDERKPFLAQAEQEKMEYEAARRLYEDGAGSPGYGTNINFSILPGSLSPAPFPTLKLESESESEGDSHGPRTRQFRASS